MSPSTDRLGIFAKYWQPGTVKTRLAQRIGDESAAALHLSFLRTLLRRFARIPVSRVLAFTPTARRSEFAALVTGLDWELEPQLDGDLGRRMAGFFRSAFEQGYQRVVLIGSDSPTLPAAAIKQSFEYLVTDQVVLGPSTDGGYYLVGAAHTPPPIFDGVTWSTPDVWQQTIRHLETARVPFVQLPPWYDVDEIGGLYRLSGELQREAQEDLRELAAAVRAALGNSADG